MKNLILTITEGAFICAALVLSACGSSPTIVDTTHEAPATVAETSPIGDAGTPDAQVVVNDSGLGTIVYDEKTRAKCKKVRRSGSRIRRSSCDSSSGSQPVRLGISTGSGVTETGGMDGGSSRPNN